jgi:hypothetical protein
MRDFRPRTFFKRMKFEVFLFSSSIILGFLCTLLLLKIFVFSYALVFQLQNEICPEQPDTHLSGPVQPRDYEIT